jgi:hypothetical protein
MELVGEEKRIQALFSEVRLADEQTIPRFAGVWNRAQSKTIRTQRAFNLSFVAATVLLVCAWASLAWWSKYWQQNPDVVATAPKELATGPVRVGIENEEINAHAPVPKGDSPGATSRALKLATRREASLVAAKRRATHEAKTIASWRSPTATLLDSQSDELLKSVPQLNQTVDELKSFLPSQPK